MTNPHPDIRPATIADAPRIATIHVASWQHAYRGILPDAALDAMHPAQRLPMWEQTLSAGNNAMSVIVAEVDGAVIGFASVGASDEHPAASGVEMLYTIYLDPAFVGRGAGSALLRAAESVMRDRGGRRATLRVLAANAATRAFYERHGWRLVPDSLRHEEGWQLDLATVRYEKDLKSDTPITY